jgi:hypothetical protein
VTLDRQLGVVTDRAVSERTERPVPADGLESVVALPALSVVLRTSDIARSSRTDR